MKGNNEINKRDERGCRIVGAYAKKYSKVHEEVGDMADLGALLDVSIEQVKNRVDGKPPTYEDSTTGLAAFMDATRQYFEYIRDCNLVNEQKLYPDIEGWCIFLGITRQTVLNYAKRNEYWRESIAYVKDAILAAKKQLAFRFKIPPVVYLNDVSNNHEYLNTSEFKLIATDERHNIGIPQISREEIAERYHNRETIRQELIEEGWIAPPQRPLPPEVF